MDWHRPVDAGRQVLSERAAALGLRPLASAANFLLIRVAHRVAPDALAERLRQRGYVVKASFAHPALAPCIRVTLGPPGVMTAFGDALAASV